MAILFLQIPFSAGREVVAVVVEDTLMGGGGLTRQFGIYPLLYDYSSFYMKRLYLIDIFFNLECDDTILKGGGFVSVIRIDNVNGKTAIHDHSFIAILFHAIFEINDG